MEIPGEKIVGITFDEMKLADRAEYDHKIDAALGPNKWVQQVLVKSLVGDWEVPIWQEFDQAVTKKNLFRIIKKLEEMGLIVLLTVCDQGPKNQKLANKLGISPENVFFVNPADNRRKVIFTFDFVHAFKNLR